MANEPDPLVPEQTVELPALEATTGAALKAWALGSLKALAGALVAVLVPVLAQVLLHLPDYISVPSTAAGVGAAVYRVRNRG